MALLDGLANEVILHQIRELTNIRVDIECRYGATETIVAYENKMISEVDLLKACIKYYGRALELVRYVYVPAPVISFYRDKKCIPFKVDLKRQEIHIGVLPEEESCYIEPYEQYKTVRHLIPIFNYAENYCRMYGTPDFLGRVPERDIFKYIVDEAIELDASEITIASRMNSVEVYFEARRKIIHSNRLIDKHDMEAITKYIETESGAVPSTGNMKPEAMSLDLDMKHRGRVEINRTYFGKMISIRLLPKEPLNRKLEELNLDSRVVDFIRKYWLSKEPGLRIIVGPTSSGKNTTILTALKEVADRHDTKIVSAESPVEIIVDGIEQLPCETEEIYKATLESFIRIHPGICYPSEMTAMSSIYVMELANTGKPVFTSVHANSISDVVSRIQDLTGLSIDKVVANIQSVVSQDLIRDDEKDKLFPVNRCMYFSKSLKRKLLGKSIGEVTDILSELEEGGNVIEN